MAGRPVYDPQGFKNEVADGKICGFSFRFKLQYYRGITLSIIREMAITIDGEKIDPADVRITVNGETFTMDEIRTVVSSNYRWEFGEYARITVLKDKGLAAGKHHISVLQHIAPSYMPFPLKSVVEADFEIA